MSSKPTSLFDKVWDAHVVRSIADGPDEVHRNAIAKLELARYMSLTGEELELPVTRS
jgi:acyl-CoA dehydrogenase